MGPIEKKINEYLKKSELSEEVKQLLTSLKQDISELEPSVINQSYFQGFSDKERGKSLNWNFYNSRYQTIKINTKK